jgi:phage shock protein E
MKRVGFYGLLVVSLIAIIGTVYLYQYAVNSKYRICSQDAKKHIQAKEYDVVLDVRTNLERKTLGYFPGSLHIESKDLEKEMPNRFPNKNIRILVYCNTGHRARLATDKLHKLGYTNAVYISSGYKSLL